MSNFNSADIAAFKDVWVFCEQREGKLMPTDFELISKGRDLANEFMDTLEGAPKGDIRGAMALLIDKAQKSGVTSEVTLEPTVTAPVSRGQRLGTLTVKSGDLVLKEVPLVAAQEVERLSYGEIYRMVLMRAAMAKADAPEAAKIPEKM